MDAMNAMNELSHEDRAKVDKVTALLTETPHERRKREAAEHLRKLLGELATKTYFGAIHARIDVT